MGSLLALSDIYEPEFLAKFRDRVQLADWGCLEWTGTRDRHGYGVVTVGGRSVGAYRIAWMLRWNKLIPADLVIDHMCCNKACVNAHHLEAVTLAENTRRITKPAPGWRPVPQPHCFEAELLGRRWFEVQWMGLAEDGRVKRKALGFATSDEAEDFMRRLVASPKGEVDEVPAEIRRKLNAIFTEDGVESWLRTPHRDLERRRPIELIRCGQAAEVAQVLSWVP